MLCLKQVAFHDFPFPGANMVQTPWKHWTQWTKLAIVSRRDGLNRGYSTLWTPLPENGWLQVVDALHRILPGP